MAGVTTTRALLRGVRQVGVFLPMADYLLIQQAAATKRTTLSALMLELMEPGLKRLRAKPPKRDDDD